MCRRRSVRLAGRGYRGVGVGLWRKDIRGEFGVGRWGG
jgi:hypothetical protein